jgi:aminoglycoside phosphotransferase (APT) family kinase protein
MLSQQTPPELIEQERRLVQQLTGVSGADQVVLNDGGWTSRVYIAGGGRFVVKFPRGEAVRHEYASEIAILTLLARIEAPVQLPRLRWRHPDNAYLGYEGIIGDQFAPLAARTDADTRKALGRAIGRFLKQLHSLTLEGARVVTTGDEIEEFQYKYRLSSPVIARDFTKDEQARLARLVEEEMPAELVRLGEDRALCHGDLGLWNMVLSQDGRIGIVDFGDSGYFDRSKDFMGLRDPDLLDSALEAYGDDQVLRQKIAIRQKILNILDLPFFIGKADAAGIGKTVAEIKVALSQSSERPV